MANMPGTPNNINHLREKNFKSQLSVSRLPTVDFFCVGATMPGFTVGEIVRPGLNKGIPEPGNRLDKDPLTIQFIVDEDAKNWQELYNWMIGMTFPESFQKSREWIDSQKNEVHPYKSNLRILALKNSMFPNLAYDFHNAFPIALDGFDFTAAGSDETIVASTTFVFSHMTIENISL